MPSREVRAALRQLQIKPLPAKLDLAQPGVLARVRHRHTNYERLLAVFRFSEADYRQFKWAVNQRILEAVEATGGIHA